ncbi:uncharacterized protein METZ01_LOCUS494087, partial [marine metagenome]
MHLEESKTYGSGKALVGQASKHAVQVPHKSSLNGASY